MSDAGPAAPSAGHGFGGDDTAPMRRSVPVARFGTRAAAWCAQYFWQSARLGAPDEHVAKTAFSKRQVVKS